MIKKTLVLLGLVILSACKSTEPQAPRRGEPKSGVGQTLQHVRDIKAEARQHNSDLEQEAARMDSE